MGSRPAPRPTTWRPGRVISWSTCKPARGERARPRPTPFRLPTTRTVRDRTMASLTLSRFRPVLHCCFVLHAAASAQTAPPLVAVRAGTLIDGLGGAPVRNVVVLVEGE